MNRTESTPLGTTTTVDGVTDDLFASPVSRTSRRRRQLAVAVLVAAVVIGSVTWQQASERKTNIAIQQERTEHLFESRLCPNVPGLSSTGYALSRQDGECIGWTADQPAFDQDSKIGPVVDKIIAENKRVEAQPDQAVPYVRVAVLMPMTGKQGSPMPQDRIMHALEGIYTALLRANSTGSDRIADPKPLIQMVLANEGQDQSHWPYVEGQLATMARPRTPHPVVAAVGLSIGLPKTQDLANRLSYDNIPSVAAVVSATTITAPELFKVSPSNEEHTQALKHFVDSRPALRDGKAFLLYDSNNDEYVQTLADGFRKDFADDHLDQNGSTFSGQVGGGISPPDMFYGPIKDICIERPDILLYAGRDVDLVELIEGLEGSQGCAQDRPPLTILTAATGMSVLQQHADLIRAMPRAKLSVVYASTTDPDRWARGGPGVPPGYSQFRNSFTNSQQGGFSADDLSDGYAIMHYDAALTAIQAIQGTVSTGLPPGTSISGAAVLQALRNTHLNATVPGASGSLSFDDGSQGWPRHKAIRFVQLPATDAPPAPDFITP